MINDGVDVLPVGDPDVGDVGPLHVVPFHPRLAVPRPKPVLLGLVWEPRLKDGIASNFTQVTAKYTGDNNVV